MSEEQALGDPVVVMITSPLETEFATQIAEAFPGRIELIYRPDLMPELRYVGDHGDPSFRRSPEQQREWHELLQGAEVLFDFPQHESRPLQELIPNVRWVQTTSAGVGPLVKRLGLQDSDLIVTTASGIHAQPLAEFAFAALLFHSKELGRLLRDQQEHAWHRFCGGELVGQTMAIIGPGKIGQEVARIARAFRMHVVAMGRRHDPARAEAIGVDRLYAREDLHAMLAQADCLVISAPHTPQTDGMLGAAEFAALKPGAVFINIGRGQIVDEAALLESLRSGRIAFAALDVFQTEPLPPDSPFWDLPNVLINPHSASTVFTENAKIVDVFLRNLGHYLSGNAGAMSPVLDKHQLY